MHHNSELIGIPMRVPPAIRTLDYLVHKEHAFDFKGNVLPSFDCS
jgi:hypothetical protein